MDEGGARQSRLAEDVRGGAAFAIYTKTRAPRGKHSARFNSPPARIWEEPPRVAQFGPPGNRKRWGAAFGKLIDVSDGVLANSKQTAKTVLDYLAEEGLARPVCHFYMGADFTNAAPQRARAAIPITPRREPVVLSVSTIEPRKNYSYALELCSRLWSQGFHFRYVIVGNIGWSSTGFVSAMRRHPEFGRRLIHYEGLDDARVAELYRGSACYLSTSLNEGFGLPLMEAFWHGLPALCSDIPIFRETCGANARYLPLQDAGAAAEQLGPFLDASGKRSGGQASELWPAPPALLSWRQSAEHLFDEIACFHAKGCFRNDARLRDAPADRIATGHRRQKVLSRPQ